MTMPAQSPQPRSKLKRLLRWLSLVSLLLILGLSFTLWLLLTSPPKWWAASGALPPDAAERAAALERGGSRALSEPRDDSQPWTISISESDANAWLSHRLKRWAENREIEGASLVTADGQEIAPPRVHCDHGRLRLGIEINGRVIGLSAIPAVEGNALLLREPRCFVGRVELSTAQTSGLAAVLTDRLGSNIPEESREFIRALLAGSKPLFDPAVFPLDDGREVSVLRVVIEGDKILVTCQTSTVSK